MRGAGARRGVRATEARGVLLESGGQAAQELERERLILVSFPQSDSRMIPASQRLYDAIIEQRLTLPDDPELTSTPPTPSPATRAADGGSTKPPAPTTSTP